MLCPLLLRHARNGLPEGSSDDGADLLPVQPLLPVQVVDDIGNDLRIRLEGTFVAVHFNGTAVCVIGGNLPVVDNRVIQQGEGMCAPPPARGIGGISAVGGEAVAGVFVQPVEPAHILREAHCLEYAHVLAAGENVAALDPGVDVEHALCHEFPFIQLTLRQLGGQGGHEVPPDQRHVRDLGHFPGGDLGQVDDVKVTLQEPLALLLGGAVIIENVECVILLVFRIDAVGSKAAPQTVGAVMHHFNGTDDLLAVHPFA